MAIAFNNAASLGNNGGSTNSLTASYTCSSGTGRVLLVAIVGDLISGADDITSVTYAGTAMTLVQKITTGDDRFGYLYALANPATGANNVVISCTANHFLIAGAADYTGASATLGSSNQSVSTAGVTSFSDSITTSTDNSWVVGMGQAGAGGAAIGVGSGTTSRATDASFASWVLIDSGSAVTPAGSKTLTITRSTNANKMEIILLILAPGNITNNKTLTITQGQTVKRTPTKAQTNHITSPGAIALARAAVKGRTITITDPETVAVVHTKLKGAQVTIAQGETIVVTRIRQRSFPVATILQGQLLNAAQRTFKTIAVLGASAVLVATTAAHQRLLAVLQGEAAGLVVRFIPARLLAVFQGQSVTAGRFGALSHRLSVITGQFVFNQRLTAHALATAIGQGAALHLSLTFNRLLAVAQPQAFTIRRVMQHAVMLLRPQALVLRRQATKTFALLQGAVAALTRTGLHQRALALLQPQAPALLPRPSLQKTFAVLTGQAVAMRKAAAHLLVVVGPAQVIGMLRAAQKPLPLAANQNVVLIRGAGKRLALDPLISNVVLARARTALLGVLVAAHGLSVSLARTTLLTIRSGHGQAVSLAETLTHNVVLSLTQPGAMAVKLQNALSKTLRLFGGLLTRLLAELNISAGPANCTIVLSTTQVQVQLSTVDCQISLRSAA